MEPWAFDSPAMRQLMGRVLSREIPPLPISVARTDDDEVITRLLLRSILGNGDSPK